MLTIIHMATVWSYEAISGKFNTFRIGTDFEIMYKNGPLESTFINL